MAVVSLHATTKPHHFCALVFQALALIVLVAGGKYAMGAAAFIACTIGLLIGFLGDTRRTE